MMKITGLSHLFKWENLRFRFDTKTAHKHLNVALVVF